MGTVQHRDLAGEELHPPGSHAEQHHTAGSDPLAPADIGAAAAAHQHDAAYAALGHNHDAAYAAQGHQHDASYAPLAHNHDAAYAAAGHHHDAAYAPQDHNHNTTYAPLVHNHDAAYAAQGHDHADLVKADGSRAFTAPVGGKQFATALYDNVNAPAIDWANGLWQRLTLNGNKTLTFANAATGCKLILVLVQDGTGTRTVSWPAGTKWEGGTAPTLSTAANAVDILALISDGTNYYGQIYGLNFMG